MGVVNPLITLGLILLSHRSDVIAQSSQSLSPGDVRLCLGGASGDGLYRFEVLPGSGWDNLRNVQGGAVVALNYSQCRTTDDGRYVIPDLVNVYPVKTSRIDSFAEIMDQARDYVSATNKDINMDAGIHGEFSISGSFDDDLLNVKKSQMTDDTFTTRMQARYVRYRAVLQPDMPLDPGFKYRLMSIAGSLELGQVDQARFGAQQLVREFGTHVSTGLDAGAAIIQENQISNDIKTQTDYSDKAVKMAAGVTFATEIGHLFAGVSHTTTQQTNFVTAYTDNRTDSVVRAIGGAVVNRTNTSLEDWVSQMSNSLVAVGRSGEPIYSFINAQTVPELPGSTLKELVDMVQESVSVYYKVNTHPGCTDRTMENFSPRANLNDGSCRPPAHNTTLGGVYQTCNHSNTEAGDLCADLLQTNPATGGFSCPTGYEAIPLYSGNKTRQAVDHVCGSCWLVFGHCCHDESRVSAATYQTFWCSPTDGPETVSGYLYGGSYTSHLVNPVTGAMSCPHAYVALRIGEGARVCVSDQFEEALDTSVPFAGFYSCQTGNPLALGQTGTALHLHMYQQGPTTWPRHCPLGYSSYVTEFTQPDGCEVNHCVQTSAMSSESLPSIRRPPYIPAPSITPNPQNVFVFDPSQNLWVRDAQAVALNRSQKPTAAASGWEGFWGSAGRKEEQEDVLVIDSSHSSPHHHSHHHSHHREHHEEDDRHHHPEAAGMAMTSLSVTSLVLLMLAVCLNVVLLAVVLRRGKGHGGHGKWRGQGLKGHDNLALNDVTVDEKRKF